MYEGGRYAVVDMLSLKRGGRSFLEIEAEATSRTVRDSKRSSQCIGYVMFCMVSLTFGAPAK